MLVLYSLFYLFRYLSSHFFFLTSFLISILLFFLLFVGEIASEQDFSVDPYEPHPDFRFSKGAIMSENEWIDLSDNMEKTDGYVKRDAQAMKDRPGEENVSLSLSSSLILFLFIVLPISFSVLYIPHLVC